MSLSEIWHLLKRKWLILLLTPLALGVSTYFFARHLPKTYSSDTTIYTGIASGYSLKGDAGGDYYATSNAFDNLVNLITARITKQEAVFRLLASHLWETHQNPVLLNTPAYESLRDGLPSTLRQSLTGPSPESTLKLLRNYALANTTNKVYVLLNSTNPTYSLTALSHLTASRLASSDLIKLEFESYNAKICQATLQIITQVFLENSKNLREGQTSSVIDYYEAEMKRAKARLAKAESASVAFNNLHHIINYDEQAKDIATEKEALASEVTQVSQQYAGSLAALKALNSRLGGRTAALSSSAQMLEQRRKLSSLNAAIADQQLFGQQAEANTSPKVKQLQAEADQLTVVMQSNADKYYAHTNSVEGIPSKQLLTDWVQNMALVEANRAKLGVMYQRKRQFDQEYARMAPLSATIKGIEREIDLAEKSYLSTLANLNASRATQQNTQLTANLKIIDPPNLPRRPKTNTLLILVLAGTMGGGIFATSLVVGLGVLDRSLRRPAVAASRIGLPVVSLLLDPHHPASKRLQLSQQRNIDQLVRHILLLANTPPAPVPFVVGVFSVQRQEGKTTLCEVLAQRCHTMGVQTLTLYSDDHKGQNQSEGESSLSVSSLYYPAELAAVQGWQLKQLIHHALPRHIPEGGTAAVRVVLLEFPALREEIIPFGVLQELNLALLTVPATRTWRPVDHQAVERLRMVVKVPVEVVLSHVAPDYYEETFV